MIDINAAERELIDRYYAECALAAREKGLTGLPAIRAVYSAVAKLATKNFGRAFTLEDIQQIREGSNSFDAARA